MDDFFKAVYDHALECGALNHEDGPGYRAALERLHALTDGLRLDAGTYNQLMHAVYDLLYCADLDCLSYGFRLAAQVITPAPLAYPGRA